MNTGYFTLTSPFLSRVKAWAFILLVLVSTTLAAEVSITANLSANSTTTEDPVRLTITVNGARNANLPSQIQVDGLEIDFRGKSQQFQMSSSVGISMSTVATYLIMPQKAGKFTIPAITLQANGQNYHTEPLTLTVERATAISGNPADQSDEESSKSAQIYAELLIPKSTAYVGEVIPVEVRFYFAENITAQLNPPGQVPQIDGEGFSKLRFPQPRIERKIVNGKSYQVLAYQTGIVAAKSGDLDIGPGSLNFVVSIPQKRRPRSTVNDPFDDFFNSNPFFSNQPVQREMTVTSEPGKIHILPLPTPRPDGFSGAVGQFTLNASAKPLKANIGDPVTLTSTISGRGNFDLVSAPDLTDSAGWRTYPTSGKFTATDEIGIAGDKAFDMALIPEKNSSAIPPVKFVYFDPAQKKYLILTSPPISVQIEGQPVALAPSQAPTANPSTKIAPSVAGKTPDHPKDALPQLLTSLSGEPKSFTPIWKSKIFLALQSIPLLLLGALLWPKIATALAPTTAKRRLTSLEAERGRLSGSLRSADPAIFFPAAARQLETEALLKLPSLPANSTLSTSDILEQIHLSDEQAETARDIFRRRDELTYGGGRGGKELTPEAMHRYQDVLQRAAKV